MKSKYKPVVLFALVTLVGGVLLLAKPFNPSTDDDIVIPSKDNKESTEKEALPEGRKLFVDPNGRFSFQYESNGDTYMVELIYKTFTNSPDIFSVCDALNCYSVGVQVEPLRMAESDRPTYNYKRLTHDREIPDSFQPIVWKRYPAYKAVFAWQADQERYLYIHIPHNGQLFTLYRSARTGKDELQFRQFSVISETFRLLD